MPLSLSLSLSCNVSCIFCCWIARCLISVFLLNGQSFYTRSVVEWAHIWCTFVVKLTNISCLFCYHIDKDMMLILLPFWQDIWCQFCCHTDRDLMSVLLLNWQTFEQQLGNLSFARTLAIAAFDLIFFIFITTIGLNIIFGIIVDTFSELRDSKVSTFHRRWRHWCHVCRQLASHLQVGQTLKPWAVWDEVRCQSYPGKAWWQYQLRMGL